jgi:hypothetical protein
MEKIGYNFRTLEVTLLFWDNVDLFTCTIRTTGTSEWRRISSQEKSSLNIEGNLPTMMAGEILFICFYLSYLLCREFS